MRMSHVPIKVGPCSTSYKWSYSPCSKRSNFIPGPVEVFHPLTGRGPTGFQPLSQLGTSMVHESVAVVLASVEPPDI